MAGFQIYVPIKHSAAVSGPDRHIAVLSAIGLDALASSPPSMVETRAGPDSDTDGPGNGHGFFIGWNAAGDNSILRAHKADLDWQPWQSVKDDLPAGRFWLGRNGEVTPATLRRDEASFSSFPAILRDGQVWEIPIATALPHRWGLNESGNFNRVIEEQFKVYSERCVEYFQVLQGASQGDDMTFADGWDFCCQALAMNYIVTPEIISWLGLLDEKASGRIIGAALELDLLGDHLEEKKTDDQ